MGALGSRLGLRRLASVAKPSVGRGRGGGGGIRPEEMPARPDAGRLVVCCGEGEAMPWNLGDWRSVEARNE